MKALILILLLCFISCSKETKNEKCSFNGQSIPCNQMPGQVAEPDTTSLRGTKLQVEITAAISLNSRERNVEVLENTHDLQTARNHYLEVKCGLETRVGQIASYTLNRSTANLNIDGEILKLTRLSGLSYSLIGEWQSHYVKDGVRQTLLFTFTGRSMNIRSVCTIL